MKGSPLDERLDEASHQALLAEATEKLAVFCENKGGVSFPMEPHIVTARKASSGSIEDRSPALTRRGRQPTVLIVTAAR